MIAQGIEPSKPDQDLVLEYIAVLNDASKKQHGKKWLLSQDDSEGS